jgi:hypothetical protein
MNEARPEEETTEETEPPPESRATWEVGEVKKEDGETIEKQHHLQRRGHYGRWTR